MGVPPGTACAMHRLPCGDVNWIGTLQNAGFPRFNAHIFHPFPSNTLNYMASFSLRGRTDGGCGTFLEGPHDFFKDGFSRCVFGKKYQLLFKIIYTLNFWFIFPYYVPNVRLQYVYWSHFTSTCFGMTVSIQEVNTKLLKPFIRGLEL